MSFERKITRGTLRLHPFPCSIYYEDGGYDRTTMVNRKNGISFELLSLKRKNLPPDIRVYGDIPIRHEDVDAFKREIKKVAFSQCEVRELHIHEGETDVHPKCNFHNEKFFITIFPKIYEISQKYADRQNI